ncbi:MAG: hypothetical protein FD161_1215 [Limisphaerales bacterium]|nr:MAG: hypothetical protein FD161_1215 [Limisphaerales bacterium]TXT49485.1 MAG: hypothetical protein FD140_3017 [Limisphaerales bacterium]
MSPPAQRTFPSAAVKVRLLQDAVYSEDEELWPALLRHRPHIEHYFQEIGLELVVHEDDGFAYLKQAQQEEQAGMPRLFRRDKLTKGVAIIGVVLREQLLRFDEKIHDESRLILRMEDLVQLAAPFFSATNDEIRTDKRIEGAIRKAEEMGLLRRLPGAEGEERFEVRRILKARFPVETLKELREQLQAHVNAHDQQ